MWILDASRCPHARYSATVSEATVELIGGICRWADGASARDLIAEDVDYVNPHYAVESGTRRQRRALASIRDVYPDFRVEAAPSSSSTAASRGW